jgi:glycosyltransferase involved in cell wall biosynthesis
VTVGLFSPLPPAHTGVADYSAALLDALRARCEVRIGSTEADVCLYHLGNNQLHAAIYQQALARPGVAVLHDAVLHHLFLGLLDRHAYIEEFVYNYGEPYRGLAAALWDARARSAQDARFFERAMVRRIAEVSRAVVVHNPAAARIVRAHAPSTRIVEIPFLFAPQAPVPPEKVAGWRAAQGIGEGTFLFGVFGYLRESKRLHSVLRAFDTVRKSGAKAALLIAGDIQSRDLEAALEPLLATPGVMRAGHSEAAEFAKLVSAVDACVNLRYPSAGETSAIAIRLMGAGKPVLVNTGEENASFPEGAVIRIDPGVAEQSMLVEYMMWLVANPPAARQIGVRAAEHISAHHSLEDAARRYGELLASCC